jgi:hypothetical protein
MTALDVSDSIVRDEESLEFEGLAKALVGDAVLNAIAGGQHGRIGFAAFAWSSAGRFETVVPWILIGSAADAERAATPFCGSSSWIGALGRSAATAPAQRRTRPRCSPTSPRSSTSPPPGARRALCLAARGDHVCADGEDNIGADPRRARSRDRPWRRRQRPGDGRATSASTCRAARGRS